MNWRRPDRQDRQVAALWAICALALIALRPVWLGAAGLLPACPFHAWAGWPCPGCGTTRAVSRLLHADLWGAVRFNPLAAIGSAGFLVGGLGAPVWLACGGPAPSLPTRTAPFVRIAAVAAVLANWAWIAAAGV